MRDVDYAFFSQMSYLNWENLNIKNIKEAGSSNSVTNILNTKELWNILSPSIKLKKKSVSEYAGNDKRLFMKYSLEGAKKTIFDFSEWEFLLGAGYGDIYKLYLKKKEKITNNKYKGGFRGIAFKNGNKIIIAFNGGEKLVSMKKDIITIDDMKMYDRNYAPLIAGYWFYKYIKEKYCEEGDEIYLTGNKYGGFIAQYVYMATGGNDRTVVWNPIGSGINTEIKETDKPHREFPDLKIILGYSEFTKEVAEKVYSKFLLENRWVSPIILKDDAKDEILQIFEEIREETEKGENKISKRVPIKFSESMEILYYILLTNYFYNDDYTRKAKQSLMYTYLIEDEWSVYAINRIGAVIDIVTGIRTERKIVKKSTPPPYELPFPTEELNDVIMFMNDQGNLEYGKMREEFVKNSLKSVIKAQMKILLNDNILVKKELKLEIKKETLEDFDIKYYSAGALSNGRKFGLERKLNPEIFRYMKVMRDNILYLQEPYEILPCEEKEGKYKEYIELGKYINIRSLGDINCGYPLKIYIAE
ncbi:hypothetical protein [Fusobacterium varium]|uniref:hypothetical protein n=1 Tax=Fusobacterium varium TaxID=856 RepID=UPI000BBA7877|nr:hypothetical protein [uncultured Fusobacterium sp.]BBA53166.1 hypothetical protein FV113G1_35190 [Fusobacterium varium]